mmetsp:Transcript_13833/g.37121  ORF Transcript_13833/g.37121 Transcript_13833/m.37121 type:complete len:272 (+) Transcript_13833:723-1538(+)
MKNLVRQQSLVERGVLCANLIQRFTVRQCVRLRKKVAHQFVMIGHWLTLEIYVLLPKTDADKVARHRPPLVDKLIKRVLSICARFPKYDFASRKGHRRAIEKHAFSVGLHCDLLNVRRQLGERLIVWQQRIRWKAQKRRIPHAEQTHHHWDVPAHTSSAKMLVDRAHSGQKLLHHFIAILQRKRKHPDRRRYRITSADPVPKYKHVVLVDSILLHQIRIRRNGNHVLGNDVFATSKLSLKPRADCPCVEHRFGCGESFRDHDDQRCLSIEP